MSNSIKNIIYLGPIGSYTQIAAEAFCAKFAPDAHMEGISTIAKIIGEIDADPELYAIVPIENSIEGIVRETIDNLIATKNNPKILSQHMIPIRHCLIGKGKKEEIEYIISHPQALSQCQGYIAANFGKNIEILSANSTSQAACLLDYKDTSHAAIANEFCANLYNIGVIEKNINDIETNFTRFILIGQKEVKGLPKTRTSIAFSTKNEVGALSKVLTVFEKHNLNLIYIESRPSKHTLGEYVFFADIDRGEGEIAVALNEIEKICDFYRLLGSYGAL